MPNGLTERQRRLIDAILILGVIALGFLVLSLAGTVFYAFGDVILVFFLAWLLSFVLSPLINGVQTIAPRLPRPVAVLFVYAAILVLFVGTLLQLSASLATSIGDLIDDAPELQIALADFLAGVERRLASFGFTVDLVEQAPVIVENLQRWAAGLVGPLQSIALASIGALGNLLIIVMLSLYIALDRTSIVAFLYRLVPPAYATEARLLQTSVGRSFGGFLRGQLIMGISYGAIAALANMLLGLQYGAATSVLAGALHAIPFFGPFVSWAPPVVIAVLIAPDAILPTLLIMGLGWFVTMNFLQPRLMAGAVGIHPVVVLGSVVVGTKVAGIAGAIFGIPIAAVLSAFFFHFYGRSRESGTVADRATRRLEAREGRSVRRPVEPVPGIDEDVAEDEAAGGGSTSGSTGPALPTAAPARDR